MWVLRYVLLEIVKKLPDRDNVRFQRKSIYFLYLTEKYEVNTDWYENYRKGVKKGEWRIPDSNR
jgi:hypothetical protein